MDEIQKNRPTIEKPAVELLKILNGWNLPVVTQNLEADIKQLVSGYKQKSLAVDVVFYGIPDAMPIQSYSWDLVYHRWCV